MFKWFQRLFFTKKGSVPLGVELSYSKVKSYLECPWLYRTLYVEMKRRAPTAPSSLGLSIHRALEAYHADNSGTLDRLLECYNDHWVHVGFSSPQEQMIYFEKGRKMLEQYWNMDQSRKTKIVFVEKEFIFPLDPFVVRGIIDRVDLNPEGQYEVIDYKTQQELLSEEELSRDLQLGLYGMALKQAFQLSPSFLSLFFLAHGKVVSIPYNPSGESSLREKLLEVGLKISREEFPPRTSHCVRCEFRQTCQYSTERG
ncbi:MAG: PD-(D/E)XK nuclease family protein [Elusimicrobia bacterium]|nr:PD-(D/E)XK nuclease family protein [Elusimicrobiota bacterium]